MSKLATTPIGPRPDELVGVALVSDWKGYEKPEEGTPVTDWGAPRNASQRRLEELQEMQALGILPTRQPVGPIAERTDAKGTYKAPVQLDGRRACRLPPVSRSHAHLSPRDVSRLADLTRGAQLLRRGIF